MHKKQQEASVDTPHAPPRFQQAPGGNASITLCDDPSPDVSVVQPPAARGPVGGTATIILGVDDSQMIFNQHAAQREAVVETPVAAPRFQQAPGGTSTIILGGAKPTPQSSVGRQAPGGTATVILGGDYPHDILAKNVSANQFANGSNQNCGNTITERPTTRLHQAPGGTSTICLGDGTVHEPVHKISANQFAVGSNQNAGNVLTDRPITRLHQAPGGTSTICLGGNYPNDIVDKKVSANQFANGTNQNAGNTITDRPTTRLHQAPGGTSTIFLGSDVVPTAVDDKTSANQLAHDAAKNCQSSSVKRSQQAPGGNSTVCLGSNSPPIAVVGGVSANKFANGANQNCGNTITDRPTTRLHHAPGGASTVCLGSYTAAANEKEAITRSSQKASDEVGDENVNTANIISNQDSKEPLKRGDDLILGQKSGRQEPGGAQTVVLG